MGKLINIKINNNNKMNIKKRGVIQLSKYICAKESLPVGITKYKLLVKEGKRDESETWYHRINLGSPNYEFEHYTYNIDNMQDDILFEDSVFYIHFPINSVKISKYNNTNWYIPQTLKSSGTFRNVDFVEKIDTKLTPTLKKLVRIISDEFKIIMRDDIQKNYENYPLYYSVKQILNNHLLKSIYFSRMQDDYIHIYLNIDYINYDDIVY